MSKKEAIYLRLPADFKSSVVWRDWGSALELYELKDVIQFKAKVKGKDLGGGRTTGPHRILIPKTIYLELGKWVEVFIVEEGK